MDNRTVGILGGGQLGRMMVEAAVRLGIRTVILDPLGKDSPAGQISELAVEGSFKDPEKVREIAKLCDILTVEIEHVNVDILDELEAAGTKIQPSPSTLRIIQDKFLQKTHLAGYQVPLPDFMDVPDIKAAENAGQRFGYPYMLKTWREAYDGKGNRVVHNPAEVAEAVSAFGRAGLYAERMVDFTKELAVMVVMGEGDQRLFPVVDTIQRNNVCHTVIAPSMISRAAMQNALAVASKAISSFTSGRGIFGVEMFLLANDTVLLNEIAPRPHNSGHFTMDACVCDQFEQHLRAVLGLPLGATDMIVPAAVMVNFLGEETMEATKRPLQEALAVDGAGIHWYNKAEARKGRKMAHITYVGDDAAELLAKATTNGGGGGGGDSSSSTTTPPTESPVVGIIMGSDSDLPTMKAAAQVMLDFKVPFEMTIVSAHRTPARLYSYAEDAAGRGLKVIIAGAGGAAHLPGMVAAMTPLPVIGVPVKSSTLSGVDSLYSIVQMPRGVPVATVAIGNAMNAGLLAVRMLGCGNPTLQARMRAWMSEQEDLVLKKADKLEAETSEVMQAGNPAAAKERLGRIVPAASH